VGSKHPQARRGPGLGVFERYLTLWVLLCIGVGILLGKAAPDAARFLDSLAIHVGGAPVVSIPIAAVWLYLASRFDKALEQRLAETRAAEGHSAKKNPHATG